MSNIRNLCTEGIVSEDSVVTNTTKDSDEQNTPKILCGLQGLGKKNVSDIALLGCKAKTAPSIVSTNQSSPLVPFQVTDKRNEPSTSKQDSNSEMMSPSILPQTDRWTESFSVIPSFLKKKDKSQTSASQGRSQSLTNQSQSLLPQTERKKTKSSFSRATSLSKKSPGGMCKKKTTTKSSNTAKKQKKKLPFYTSVSSTETNVPSQIRKTSEQANVMLPFYAGVNSTETNVPNQTSKTSEQANVMLPFYASVNSMETNIPSQTSKTSELAMKKTFDLKKPSSLTTPAQTQKSSVVTEDVTTKISERIEKQLSELENAPRQRMLVIEAALIHCVTNVHDNIEKKLKKLRCSYKVENADILRKLLQTLKTTLVRLIEHHKKEREQFAMIRASQLPQEEAVKQKNLLLELGKRQKKVLDLFTKQKELAKMLNEIEKSINTNRELNKGTVAVVENKSEIDNSNRNRPVKDLAQGEYVHDRIGNDELEKQEQRNDNVESGIDQCKFLEKNHHAKTMETNKEETDNNFAKKEFYSQSNSYFGSGEVSLSQETGSGLLDILKIFGNKKRQRSLYSASSNSQYSCTIAAVADAKTVYSKANEVNDKDENNDLDKHVIDDIKIAEVQIKESQQEKVSDPHNGTEKVYCQLDNSVGTVSQKYSEIAINEEPETQSDAMENVENEMQLEKDNLNHNVSRNKVESNEEKQTGALAKENKIANSTSWSSFIGVNDEIDNKRKENNKPKNGADKVTDLHNEGTEKSAATIFDKNTEKLKCADIGVRELSMKNTKNVEMGQLESESRVVESLQNGCRRTTDPMHEKVTLKRTGNKGDSGIHSSLEEKHAKEGYTKEGATDHNIETVDHDVQKETEIIKTFQANSRIVEKRKEDNRKLCKDQVQTNAKQSTRTHQNFTDDRGKEAPSIESTETVVKAVQTASGKINERDISKIPSTMFYSKATVSDSKLSHFKATNSRRVTSGDWHNDSTIQSKIFQNTSTNPVRDNDNDSFPQAFEAARFYKKTNCDYVMKQAREETKTTDIASKDEDILLSQDVTTIPDTQETSTQDTIPREHLGDKEEAGDIMRDTRSNRKRSSSADNTVPRRKKYRKMQEKIERQLDRSIYNTEAQIEAIRKVVCSDSETSEIVASEVEIIPHVQNIDLDMSIKHSINNVSKCGRREESGSQIELSDADVKSKFDNYFGSQKVACDKVIKEKSNEPETRQISEKLWVDMKYQTAPIEFSRADSKESRHTSLLSLKSPGDKLNKVIKRITEEKENITKGKYKTKNILSRDNNARYNSNLHINRGTWQPVKSRTEKVIDVNDETLHEAGLAIALPHFKENHNQTFKSLPQMATSAKSDTPAVFSPPRLPAHEEANTDISPTATSMSSDVFHVKAKELEKRMKRRAQVSQKRMDTSEIHMTGCKQPLQSRIMKPSQPKSCRNSTFGTKVNQNLNSRTEPWLSYHPNQNKITQTDSSTIQHQTGVVKQSIKPKTSEEKLEAVIDDVIKSSVANSSGVEKRSQTQVTGTCMPRQPVSEDNIHRHAQKSRSASLLPLYASVEPNNCQGSEGTSTNTVGQKVAQPDVSVGRTLSQKSSQNLIQSDLIAVNKEPIDLISPKPPLPTLKRMIQQGVLRPGTNVLATEVKRQVCRASLTPLGQVRTLDGQTFKTPMQWLSVLHGDGHTVRRRQAYQRIMYEGHPLLSYCYDIDSTQDQPTTGRDKSVIKETSNWEETDEGRLNKFLSTCQIRLLHKIDLIPCHDLPDNFWANDFAEVKLSSDIWECVDTWN